MNINPEIPRALDCPFCYHGVSFLLTEWREFKYKEEKVILIPALFYKCDVCDAEYTTTESDEETLKTIIEYAQML